MAGLGHFEEILPVGNVEAGLVIPTGRSGHCAVADDTNMYVYGGYNPGPGLPLDDNTQVMAELLKFNFYTHSWSEIDTKNIPKTAASACMCRVANSLFAFGGTTYPWGKFMSNSLYRCDLKRRTWTKLQAKYSVEEDIPWQGYGQSICFHKDKLYIFTGAVSYFSDPVSHLHMFDLHTGFLQRIEALGHIPEGRYKQEMLVHDNRLVLLGGGFERNCAKLDHIYIYGIDANHWEKIKTLPYAQSMHPTSRACFGCALHEDWLYIFGGRKYSEDEEDELLRDAWRLNLKSFQWEKLNHLFLPSGISFPTACLSPNGFVHLYGGILPGWQRSNKIFRAQIFLPKLSEISFEKVMTYFRLSKEPVDVDTYKNIGIPSNFLCRLQPG